MPATLRKSFPKRRPAAPRSFAPVRRPALPSSAVVDAILRFSDVQEDVGGGRIMKRLSPTRLRDGEVRAALGDAAAQAGRVSVLWNDREDQIVRVLVSQPLAA
ncbi:hypothetical protein [Phenylobacterium sp.]|uniref:hypothetical protein n=1 Tax=Phenylobacterium sp. TaxID=1871053 RepID=UPI002F3E8B7E